MVNILDMTFELLHGISLLCDYPYFGGICCHKFQGKIEDRGSTVHGVITQKTEGYMVSFYDTGTFIDQFTKPCPELALCSSYLYTSFSSDPF